MRTRFVSCEYCQTEGRLHRTVTAWDGAYDEEDMGPCPECRGACVVEVRVKPIDMDELPPPAWECLHCG